MPRGGSPLHRKLREKDARPDLAADLRHDPAELRIEVAAEALNGRDEHAGDEAGDQTVLDRA